MVEKFETFLRQGNMADNTISAYQYAVNDFYSRHKDLNKRNLLLYKTYLIETFKPKTVNLRIQALNKYLDFVNKTRLRLKSVKVQQRSYLENVISNADYIFLKNKLKKVVAYVLSFMMLFTMSAMNIGSVSAASTGSITVHTGKHDVNGVNFNAYRLMDATVSGNKVSYSISSNFTGFFTEELLNGTTGDDIDIKAYNYIKANVSTTDFQNKLKT